MGAEGWVIQRRLTAGLNSGMTNPKVYLWSTQAGLKTIKGRDKIAFSMFSIPKIGHDVSDYFNRYALDFEAGHCPRLVLVN